MSETSIECGAGRGSDTTGAAARNSRPTTSERVEEHSSVKIKDQFKGEPPSIEVKVFAHDLDGAEAARVEAIRVYRATVAEVRGDGGFAAAADALERERLRS